jgi:hypothetical protein
MAADRQDHDGHRRHADHRHGVAEHGTPLGDRVERGLALEKNQRSSA